MWGDQVNRRQFLGRLFQGIQTYYTCKYGFGMYHNWHQHRPLVNIRVACYYRRTEGEKQALNSFMMQDTIIAIYRVDGDRQELVKCTAYWDGDVLVNTLSSGCQVSNVPEGQYIIKVLQIGKGIALPNDTISTYTVDATVDRATLPNNNYGYITPVDFNVELIFDISGVYFKAKPKIDTVGYWYPVGENTATRTRSYGDPHNSNILSENIALLQSWSSKMDENQRYKLGPVYTTYSDIEAIELVNISTSTVIGNISTKEYPGMGSYETNNLCINNNLDFETVYDPINRDVYYTDYNKDRISIGTEVIYQHMPYTSEWNSGNTVTTQGSASADSYTITGIANGGILNPSIVSADVVTRSIRPGSVIDGTRYWCYKYRYLYVNTTIKYQELMYGQNKMSSVRPTYTASIPLDGHYGLPVKPPFVIYADAEATWNQMNNTAQEVKDTTVSTYIYSALSNVDPTNPASDEPWLKSDVSDTSTSKHIPLDILFGHITDCLNVIGDPSPDGDTSPYHLEPMGSKFVIGGLGAYDPNKQCNNDNMWMWVSTDIPALFLKQTPTLIDLDSVPNHKIG